MAKVPVYISFDYDNDSDLKVLLVGQAKNEESPFSIIDHSIKEELSGDWKAKARTRIKRAEQVIVICGQYTANAPGVNAEIKIAIEEEITYFLINGRNGKTCYKPGAAKSTDKIYDWTWPNLKILINGGR
ncbi:MAG: hypothetical protein GY853_14695 [PVC group bacterium]|nr:hypothetical protein [PVC group bacterium]